MPATQEAPHVPDFLASPPGNPAVRNATFVLTLRDQNDLNPEGITVNVDGPVSATLMSDARGRVAIKAPPGTYRLAVAVGCLDRVIVEYGGRKTVSLVPGRERTGTLAVRWQHRIGPGLAVHPSKVPYWFLGDQIDVAFDVVDRCTSERAAGATYPTFRFETSANLQLAGEPILRADDQGHGHVRVRCTSEGRPNLVMFDSRNDGDKIDLIEYAQFPAAAFYKRGIECRKPPS